MKWQLDQFTDKDVVFVGAGNGRALTGIQEFLEKHAHMDSFAAVDKKPGDRPLDFLQSYNQAKTVFIKNEAIPGAEMPVPYVTPMQLFFALVPATGAMTIGITGTKGKSTTTALTAHILQSAGKRVVLAGNIGVSPFAALDNATAETIFVLEMSSYQLSDLHVSPHISACINLYNDHTPWHGSLDDYWEAKHNIMRFAGTDDLFIYNPSFLTLQQWAEEATCRTKPIDPNEPLDLSRAQLFGEHNRLNALIARDIARELQVSDDATQQAIESFEPLRHRMQIVATKDKRTYIDDGIGMTPESTMASLKAINEKMGPIGCVLMGGQDRGYDFNDVMQLLATLNVPELVLFPDTIAKMKAALPAGYYPHIHESHDMQDAVQYAAANAPENSVVVLSTAAPSYSLWKDFEDKGDQFQAAVNAILA